MTTDITKRVIIDYTKEEREVLDKAFHIVRELVTIMKDNQCDVALIDEGWGEFEELDIYQIDTISEHLMRLLKIAYIE